VRARGFAVGSVALLCAGVLAVPAARAADPDGHVTQKDVDRAQAATDRKAADVASVRATLAQAQQRLEAAQVAAARAGERFNGARYAAQQAEAAADTAQAQATEAAAELERQRAAYADAVSSAYQMSPQLSALGALSHADGVTDVLESTAALRNAQAALQDRYDAYDAASDAAEETADRAGDAMAQAQRSAVAARAARDTAQDAADAAAAEADRYAGERDRLVAQLADLQHVSIALAEKREDQLAAAAAAQAAADAAAAAQQEQQDTPTPTPTPVVEPTPTATPTPTPTPTAEPTTEPTPTPTPTTEPTPTPTPTTEPPPPPPPTSSGDAGAAIAFARAQLGEPYRYGASGPSSWDCSGLTMRAWEAGGKALAHYSVAQYEDATPISIGDLQPGDLLFWSDGGPSSIYHVALYVGDGMMIHAPRPGRSVEEVSMYYWITPTYFARP
jgi:peptidoglycan DL-endopeptidase CwlO